jgi:hypothetical protein
MRKSVLISLVLLVVAVLLIGTTAADRLPNQTPENQVFTMAASVEAIGSYTGSQSLQWTTGYDPAGRPALYVFDAFEGQCIGSGFSYEMIMAMQDQLVAGGGSLSVHQVDGEGWEICSISVPENMLETGLPRIQSVPGGSDVQFLGTYGELGHSLSQNGPDQIIPASHGGLHTGILDPTEVRATTAYSEMTETNGGYVSETKTFDPDTRDKAVGLFNVESTKTFTYATDANTGSIAQTAEMIATDNMGAPTPTADVVACPFGPSQSEIYPAFCNVVYAKSMSQGVTSAAQSSSAQVRMVAASADVPAELNYNFDVKPDASAGVGYAMGTFGTEFGVSIKEARGGNWTPSATLVYTDKATVAGMVAKLTKQYASKSGFSL